MVNYCSYRGTWSKGHLKTVLISPDVVFEVWVGIREGLCGMCVCVFVRETETCFVYSCLLE